MTYLRYAPEIETPEDDEQAIEDASVEWPTEESAFLTIATIPPPRQDAYAAHRVRYFDEQMTFPPAHSLAARRSLGGVMRARLQVNPGLGAFRHVENGIAEADSPEVGAVPR